MKIIADSGSTKTHWVVVTDEGGQEAFFSEGINPYFVGKFEIIEIVSKCFKSLDTSKVTSIHFYGAGCALQNKCEIVNSALAHVFRNASIQTNSDLLASAHALFGAKQGVACILGTGSNAAVFEGETFSSKIQSLGYLLGDEGSGSYIGKQFLQSYFRETMPENLRRSFAMEYLMDVPQVLDGIYRNSFPNRYLAGFSTFASMHAQHKFVQEIIRNAFKDFIKYQLSTLDFDPNYEIGFVGSIAFYFQDVLASELQKAGYSTPTVLKDPINKLVEHCLSAN